MELLTPLKESNSRTPGKSPASRKTPAKSPFRSPGAKSPFLSPNNDRTEKDKNRAARQDAQRRRSRAAEGGRVRDSAQAPAKLAPAAAALPTSIILNLYAECTKLAAENKINSKNAWNLNLIDHLSELVQPEKKGDTNFQKVSCTLDTATSIYSKKVDSVHSETFKFLCGLSRTALPAELQAEGDQPAGEVDGEEVEGDEADGEKAATGKTRRTAAPGRSSTLEESLEALNQKTGEQAHEVDPLFQKTSALFDEGGAKGLLLNNLSVHGGCSLGFDSECVPDFSLETSSASERDRQGGEARVDLGGLKGAASLFSVLGNIQWDATSPALERLLEIAGEKPSSSLGQSSDLAESTWQDQAANDLNDEPVMAELECEDDFGGMMGDSGCYDDDTEMPGGADEDEDSVMTSMLGCESFGGGGGEPKLAMDGASLVSTLGGGDGTQAAMDWLMSSDSAAAAGAAWAGPGHWHFRPTPSTSKAEGGGGGAGEKKVRKKKEGRTFDFENMSTPEEGALALAGKGSEICLASTPQASNTLLPDDMQYKMEDLVRLFLLPELPINITQLSSQSNRAGQSWLGLGSSGGDEYGGYDDDGDSDCAPGGEDFGGFGADFDDLQDCNSSPGTLAPHALGEGEEGLVAAPRKVEQVTVQYDRASKQVDVRALKEIMWSGIRKLGQSSEVVSMHDVLTTVPQTNPAGRMQDLSVHLCFICVLHLCNEHGLSIQGTGDLDKMMIRNIPVS